MNVSKILVWTQLIVFVLLIVVLTNDVYKIAVHKDCDCKKKELEEEL